MADLVTFIREWADDVRNEEDCGESARHLDRIADEITRLTAALGAEKAARRKLTELLDAQMGTPCEQIRHKQALAEAEAERDRLQRELEIMARATLETR